MPPPVTERNKDLLFASNQLKILPTVKLNNQPFALKEPIVFLHQSKTAGTNVDYLIKAIVSLRQGELIEERARVPFKEGISPNLFVEGSIGGLNTIYNEPERFDCTRREIKFILRNVGKNSIKIHNGHRIAQLIIEKIITPNPVEVYNLSETSRGSNGFGSTGVDVSIGVESKIAASDINERNIHKYVDNIKLCNEDRVQSINGKMSFKCVNCTQLLPNFPFDGEFHKVICMVCNKENMLSFKQVI